MQTDDAAARKTAAMADGTDTDYPLVISERLAALDVEADVSVDVPEKFARLVEEWADARGVDPDGPETEVFVVNHLSWSCEFTTEGEPGDPPEA